MGICDGINCIRLMKTTMGSTGMANGVCKNRKLTDSTSAYTTLFSRLV